MPVGEPFPLAVSGSLLAGFKKSFFLASGKRTMLNSGHDEVPQLLLTAEAAN